MLKVVVAQRGLVYAEQPAFSEILCKPKLLPIKSSALIKIEALETAARERAGPTSAARTGEAAGADRSP